MRVRAASPGSSGYSGGSGCSASSRSTIRIEPRTTSVPNSATGTNG